jgi:hypothetical protein
MAEFISPGTTSPNFVERVLSVIDCPLHDRLSGCDARILYLFV